LLDRQPNLGEAPTQPVWFVTTFGVLNSMGAGDRISWIVHLVVASAVLLAVCAVWAKPIRFSLKAALLCVGSACASPYVLIYDLCILSIAVAFLVQDGLACGFLRGERALIAACWMGLTAIGTPIPAIVCVVLFTLVIRRALSLSPAATAATQVVAAAPSNR
jgi:alpha-1,2-mannosyltransferase